VSGFRRASSTARISGSMARSLSRFASSLLAMTFSRLRTLIWNRATQTVCAFSQEFLV